MSILPLPWPSTASDIPKADSCEGWVIGAGHTQIKGERGPLVSFVTTGGSGHPLSPTISVPWRGGGPVIEHPGRPGVLLLVRAENDDLFDLCHARRDHVICLSCLVFIRGTILLDAHGSFSSRGDYVIESDDHYMGHMDWPAFRSLGTMSWRMHVLIKSIYEQQSPSPTDRPQWRPERLTGTQPSLMTVADRGSARLSHL